MVYDLANVLIPLTQMTKKLRRNFSKQKKKQKKNLKNFILEY